MRHVDQAFTALPFHYYPLLNTNILMKTYHKYTYLSKGLPVAEQTHRINFGTEATQTVVDARDARFLVDQAEDGRATAAHEHRIGTEFDHLFFDLPNFGMHIHRYALERI